MPGPLIFDRVKETTTTTGAGTVTLAGAVAGFQSFSDVGADADTFYYALVSGNNWEVGIGTLGGSGTTLARTAILSSSNAGAAITLSGTSEVYCTLPAASLPTGVYNVIAFGAKGDGVTDDSTAIQATINAVP